VYSPALDIGLSTPHPSDPGRAAPVLDTGLAGEAVAVHGFTTTRPFPSTHFASAAV
jgi:hypothetical protein